MLNRLCCMRLNTAGVVIGWIDAAFSLIVITVVSLALSRIDEFVKEFMDQMNDPNMDADSLHGGLIVMLTIHLTMNLINMIASAMLVVGTITERHLMLVPWLLISGLSLSFNIFYVVFFIIRAISAAVPFGSIALYMIIASIILSFLCIIWYAMYSLFKTLQQSRENQ